MPWLATYNASPWLNQQFHQLSLRKLETENLIEVSRHQILLLDHDKLEKLAEQTENSSRLSDKSRRLLNILLLFSYGFGDVYSQLQIEQEIVNNGNYERYKGVGHITGVRGYC